MNGTPLAGKVAVVTGATGGMGAVIARSLALMGAHVVTVARTAERARILRDVIDQGGEGSLEAIVGDLSCRDGVRAAASSIAAEHEALHILVNNAGAHFADYGVTSDGVERHVAVDYLAAYGMMSLLESAIRNGRARVVNVLSDTLRDTRQITLIGPARPATIDPSHLDDLTRINPPDGFVAFQAYARAKLLTLMAGYAAARELAEDGVTVNAVHPGIVATGIVDDLVPPVLTPFRGLIRRAMLTPEQGADAALRLATAPALDGVTGAYFVKGRAVTTPAVSYDLALQQRLRDTSDRFYRAD